MSDKDTAEPTAQIKEVAPPPAMPQQAINPQVQALLQQTQDRITRLHTQLGEAQEQIHQSKHQTQQILEQGTQAQKRSQILLGWLAEAVTQLDTREEAPAWLPAMVQGLKREDQLVELAKAVDQELAKA